MDATQLLDQLDDVFDQVPPLNTSNTTTRLAANHLAVTLGPVALTALHLLYLLPLPLPMKFFVVLVAHAVGAVLWPPLWPQ